MFVWAAVATFIAAAAVAAATVGVVGKKHFADVRLLAFYVY